MVSLARPWSRERRGVAAAFFALAALRAPLRVAAVGVRGRVPTPTARSEDVQKLNSWQDAQPTDTIFGEYLVGNVAVDKSYYIMNSSEIDTEMGCPGLPDLPDAMEVVAPDPCDLPEGTWKSLEDDTTIVRWKAACGISTPGLTPVIDFSAVGGGANLGQSQLAWTWFGTKVRIMNCNGQVRYTLEEKVYHETGKVDAVKCEKYKSCDGTVYFQYFLRDQSGALVARTPWIRLFDTSFKLVDPVGMELALIDRSSGWSSLPNGCPGESRRWKLRFGHLTSSNQRNLVATMATILTMRDGLRKPNGMVAPSWCELIKSVCVFLVVLLGFFVVIAVGIIFNLCFMNRLRHVLREYEQRVCPKRMRMPSKLELG